MICRVSIEDHTWEHYMLSPRQKVVIGKACGNKTDGAN